LARVPAGRAPQPALRLSRVRSVRAGGWSPFQPEQGCHGSIRQVGRSDDSMFGYVVGPGDADLSFAERDNAAFAPIAAVVDPAFTWGEDRPPRTPWHDTVIYEMHVRGFSIQHPDIPEALR